MEEEDCWTGTKQEGQANTWSQFRSLPYRTKLGTLVVKNKGQKWREWNPNPICSLHLRQLLLRSSSEPPLPYCDGGLRGGG